MYNEVTPTYEEKTALEVARIGFMAACPFYAHLFYSITKEVITKDVPTAATDGKNIFLNPTYMASLKPGEAVFVYAHEMSHIIAHHCQRMKHYGREKTLGGKKFDPATWNKVTDYVINAQLMDEGVGMMNSSWLYDPGTSPDELPEAVYQRHYKKPPPPAPGAGPQGQGKGQPGSSQGQTYGGSGKAPRGSKGDKAADAQGGSFDSLLEPAVDPVTGKEDLPDEAEFREAIARAISAAKAIGTVPGRIQRLVDEILEPKVDWREHVRMILTGHVGSRHETWNKPNRRRLVTNPIIILPGRRGHGAETVVVAVDNSGSISEKELSAAFAEISGVMADVKPKRVVLIWCDAQIQQVDEAQSLDELAEIRVKGAPGGGGTNFNPPFEWCRDHDVQPCTFIYITDGYGDFPRVKPAYPVVWAMTTTKDAPWGDVVRIEL